MEDFLYERIRRDIIDFYDNWYMGNIVCMKHRHLIAFDHHYTPGQFDGLKAKELREAKEIFLTKIQTIVNIWSIQDEL
jgi:hypothetical protein